MRTRTMSVLVVALALAAPLAAAAAQRPALNRDRIEDRFDRRENRRHREHSAAESRAQIVCFYILRNFFIDQTRADRNAAAEGFGKRDNVGLRAARQIASAEKPVSGTPDSGLHFVEDQNNSELVADFS